MNAKVIFINERELQARLDWSNRMREELERKIWEYLDANPSFDLDGARIALATHEIGFDTEMEYDEKSGCNWAVAKSVWVRPRKSEYEK